MAVEQKRLCGWRRIDGLYLCGDYTHHEACDRMPFAFYFLLPTMSWLAFYQLLPYTIWLAYLILLPYRYWLALVILLPCLPWLASHLL